MIFELDIVPIKIGKTKITLEDNGCSKGKIKIEDPDNGFYETYWGAMGGSLKEFLCQINSYYFSDRLLGHKSGQIFDVKSTFREVRKFIREELDLPWYKHIEFQKNLREKINIFQEKCDDENSETYFVDFFSFYLGTMLNFNLIDDRWERERVEEDFKISEPWHFIQTKESYESKWLKSIHGKIKNKIQNERAIG